MSERLVAITSGGRLRLMATNGDTPHEVASVELGEVDETTAVMVGAALADLRAMVTAKQRPRRVEPSRHPLEPYLTNDGKPRPHAPAKRAPVRANPRDNLSGRIVAALRRSGPMTNRELVDTIRPEATEASSPMKRVGNALHHLMKAGTVEHDTDNRWTIVGNGTQANT